MAASRTVLDLVEDRMIAIRCTRCGKNGRYRLRTLLRRFGPGMAVPDMLTALRDAGRCPRRGDRWSGCSLALAETPGPEFLIDE